MSEREGGTLTHTTVKGVCLDASFDCETLVGYFLI